MSSDELHQFKLALIEASKVSRAFARGLTRNQNDADDLVQSALLKALENWEKYESGTNIEAWLNTIVKNLFYDRVKSHSVSKTDQMTEKNSPESFDNGETHFNEIKIREINDWLIERVSERDRNVFYLWVEGLKTDQIASSLDLTRSNVGVILCRLRKAIFDEFAET